MADTVDQPSGTGLTIFLVILSIFLVVNAAVAIYSFLASKRAKGEINTEKVSPYDITDEFKVYVQGDRKGFGVFIIFFNLVATYLSGFVVVGLPDLSRQTGFIMLCFLTFCTTISIFMNIWYPRLRCLAKARNYVSTNDYIKDFWQSRTLIVLASIAGVMSMSCLIIVEWVALKSILQSLTGWSEAGSNGAVWFLAFYTIGCEFVGGMTSVALTDALQCSILFVALVFIPILACAKWGGFDALGADGESDCDTLREKFVPAWLPYYYLYGGRWNYGTLAINMTCPASADSTYGGVPGIFGEEYLDHCVPGSRHHRMQIGCISTNANTSWFYRYPAKHWAVYMWTFSLGGLCFGLNPMALQRMFIGNSHRTCAAAMSLVNAYPLVICVPLIFLGILVATVQPDCLQEEQISKDDEYCSAMGYIIMKFVESGGIFLAIALFLMCSSIASFLSTADSIIIATTTSVLVDVVKTVKPTSSPEFMINFAKITSLIIMILTVSIALYDNVDYILLINMFGAYQNLLFFMFLPIFFPRHIKMVPIIVAYMITFIVIPIREIRRQKRFDENDTDPQTWAVTSWKCFELQAIIFVAVSLFCYLYKPLNFVIDDEYLHRTWMKWDKVDEKELERFGKRKMRDAPDLIVNEAIANIVEPITHPIGSLLTVFSLVTISLIQMFPSLARMGFGYLQENELVDVKDGMPKWAITFLVMNSVCTLCLIIQCVFFWRERRPGDNWEDIGTLNWLTNQITRKDAQVRVSPTPSSVNEVVPSPDTTLFDESSPSGVKTTNNLPAY